jgi:hypothetical protein
MSGFFQPSLLQSDDSNNSFWSIFDKVLPGTAKGIGTVTSEVFPQYVATLLSNQQSNPIERTMFNQEASAPRIEKAGTLSNRVVANFTTQEMIIMGGVGLLGLIIAFKI